MEKNQFIQSTWRFLKNLFAIISFFAGLFSLIAIVSFLIPSFYCRLAECGDQIGMAFLGIIIVVAGWPISLFGLIAGLIGRKSNFKKMGVIGIYLSLAAFVLYTLIILIVRSTTS